ncbi:MAG: DPP IV N-terminal domain-containing protein, partial [Bacteroidales bacterium]|nr:DPP IV N-terminal domain-containing protein [Bacteroidales bacterium]
MLKKITCTLLCILLSSVCLFAQKETIDLEGYFQGKYLAERINGLSWQPGTDNYAYIDDDFNIKLVNAKTGKESLYLSSDKLAEENVKKVRSFQWVDANTLYFPRNQRLITVGKSGLTSYTFSDVDMEEVIDQSVKHKLFIIKNEDGVFVESVKNSYKPILICPDTGKNITFGESVHRSEWGINEGQYISPNGNYIAFYRMDESMVEDYPLVN